MKRYLKNIYYWLRYVISRFIFKNTMKLTLGTNNFRINDVMSNGCSKVKILWIKPKITYFNYHVKHVK